MYAMRTEHHDVFSSGSTSGKSAIDQTSESFVEIYIKMLNFRESFE